MWQDTADTTHVPLQVRVSSITSAATLLPFANRATLLVHQFRKANISAACVSVEDVRKGDFERSESGIRAICPVPTAMCLALLLRAATQPTMHQGTSDMSIHLNSAIILTAQIALLFTPLAAGAQESDQPGNWPTSAAVQTESGQKIPAGAIGIV